MVVSSLCFHQFCIFVRLWRDYCLGRLWELCLAWIRLPAHCVPAEKNISRIILREIAANTIRKWSFSGLTPLQILASNQHQRSNWSNHIKHDRQKTKCQSQKKSFLSNFRSIVADLGSVARLALHLPRLQSLRLQRNRLRRSTVARNNSFPMWNAGQLWNDKTIQNPQHVVFVTWKTHGFWKWHVFPSMTSRHWALGRFVAAAIPRRLGEFARAIAWSCAWNVRGGAKVYIHYNVYLCYWFKVYTQFVFLCWFSVFHAISWCFQNFETLKDDTNININDMNHMNIASKRGLQCVEFRVNDTLRRHFYRTHAGSQVLAICLAWGWMKAG